ncbi:MAG: hypothetical protein HY427_02995 [Candidatus Levybacteria bacterium]|nr:hypothetical protein [Candidatus Levybacteria bacterium]
MNFSHKIIALLLLIVALVVIVRFSPNVAPVKTASEKTTSLDYKDHPEMTDILDPADQEKRLKAGRKLVERVDVEAALEILEHSPLPHTGEGHLVVHQIGFYAYKKYGLDSILKCKDYFLYACYHGTIIEAASNAGFPEIVKMTDRCKASSVRYFQCVHAAGHAILAIWNYDVPKALETCDELYEKEKDFPEALSSCHNGAFMENLFGVHDWGTGKEQVREWLSDDPYFPCNYFGDKYQRGCWLNQAARIYQMNNGDMVKTSELCQAVDNEQYVAWCMDNVARQIHPLTNGDPGKSFELCQQAGASWYDNCLVVNAGAFYSVGGRDQAIFICQNVPPHLKTECYSRVIGQIVGDPIDREQKQIICQKLEQPFNDQCFSGLTSLVP